MASTARGTDAWPVTMITSQGSWGLFCFFENRHPVDVIHHQVGDDNFEILTFDFVSTSGAGCCAGAFETNSLQALGHRASKILVVVNDKDSGRSNSLVALLSVI